MIVRPTTFEEARRIIRTERDKAINCGTESEFVAECRELMDVPAINLDNLSDNAAFMLADLIWFNHDDATNC